SSHLRPSLFSVPPTPEFSPLSLHDALPISLVDRRAFLRAQQVGVALERRAQRREQALGLDALLGERARVAVLDRVRETLQRVERSEEHTSELQSQSNLVCRLLLEKKNKH